MTRIIRQLLAFARPRGIAEVPLRRRGARAAHGRAPPAARRRSARSRSASTASSPRTIEADAGQIEQAITNLVMNAIQAMTARGTVELAIDRTRREAPGRSRRRGGSTTSASACATRAGHRARAPAARLRALLHDEGRRRGDRAWASRSPTASSASTAAGSPWRARSGEGRRSRLPAGVDSGDSEDSGAMTRVLLVDDDSELCETLEARAEEAGLRRDLGDARRTRRSSASWPRTSTSS